MQFKAIVKRPLLLLIFVIAQVLPLAGASDYPLRLDDPKAVYVLRDNFPVHGDGVQDDSEAIQQAINKVQEATGQGIVFLPEGRYRITKTIYIWPEIRVIGYGATRPVLLLAANTPGYQDEEHEKLMIFFAGGRPGYGPRDLQRPRDPDNDQPPDANPGTFYSALSNVDSKSEKAILERWESGLTTHSTVF
jgi:Pectate lyase superfamily protein